MKPTSYHVHPNCVLQTMRARYYDVHYVQFYAHLSNLHAGSIITDIPVGPPLPKYFQIFQIRMTSESSQCEWALHTKPYKECETVDFIFKCHTDMKDEMLQETWLIAAARICTEPYCFLTFKELANENPGRSRLEIRLAG